MWIYNMCSHEAAASRHSYHALTLTAPPVCRLQSQSIPFILHTVWLQRKGRLLLLLLLILKLALSTRHTSVRKNWILMLWSEGSALSVSKFLKTFILKLTNFTLKSLIWNINVVFWMGCFYPMNISKTRSVDNNYQEKTCV